MWFVFGGVVVVVVVIIVVGSGLVEVALAKPDEHAIAGRVADEVLKLFLAEDDFEPCLVGGEFVTAELADLPGCDIEVGTDFILGGTDRSEFENELWVGTGGWCG